jgi:hypothetical protein
MDNDTLDSFESTLLGELRTVVATPRPAVRRRPLVAGIAALATAGAAAVLALVLISPNAAYAVDRDRSGDIVVTIHRLEDAEQLEDDLADLGVDASVDYDPALVQDDGSVDFPLGAGAAPEPGDEDPCGLMDDAVAPFVVQSDGDYVLTIPAGSTMAQSHLDITTSRIGDDLVLGAAFTTPDGVACAFGTAPADAPPVG